MKQVAVKKKQTERNARKVQNAEISSQQQGFAHSGHDLQGTMGNHGVLRSFGNNIAKHKPHNENRPKAVPPIIQEVLRSPGQPIDPKTRAHFEPRFGHDFSNVRVHTDARAAKSARTVNASAYTVGQDLVFGYGRYKLESSEGYRLVAHELAHVIQQSRGGTTSLSLSQSGALEQAADWAAGAAIKGRGPIRVWGSSGVRLARQPLSLNQSPNVQLMSDEKLQREIKLIKKWLRDNPGQSSERAELENQLGILMQSAAQRMLVAYERKYGEKISAWMPGELKAAYRLATITTGFAQGFLIGARQTIHADEWATLSNELSETMNLLAFNGGVQLGAPVGALESLKDNVVGIAELASFVAKYLTPQGLLQLGIKEGIEFLQDPQGYKAKRAAQARYAQEVKRGLTEFIEQMRRYPAFLIEFGYEIGQQVGQMAGRWYNTDFKKASPFWKGFKVGRVEGYVVFEIALLFLGPEAWVARGVSAAGKALRTSRFARRLIDLLEHIPGLRRILQANRYVGKIREAEKAGGTVTRVGGEIEEGAKTARLGDAPRQIETGGSYVEGKRVKPAKVIVEKGRVPKTVGAGQEPAPGATARMREKLPQKRAKKGATVAVSIEQQPGGVTIYRRAVSRKPLKRVSSEAVAERAEKIGHKLKPHPRDKNFVGEWNASHAEKQLAVANPGQPISVDKWMCQDCVEFFQKQALNLKQDLFVFDEEGRIWRVFHKDGSPPSVIADPKLIKKAGVTR